MTGIFLKITRERLYKVILDEFDKQLTTIPEGELKRGWWTAFWKSIMNNLAKRLDLEMKCEKPQKIDYSFYEHGFYDPLMAVEVEWEEKTVEQELVNLISIDCPLKVLITYSRWSEFGPNIGRVRDILLRRRRKDKDFLGLFWVYELERGVRQLDDTSLWPFSHASAPLLAVVLEGNRLKLTWKGRSRLVSRYIEADKSQESPRP